jgi:chemotaxis protein CheC
MNLIISAAIAGSSSASVSQQHPYNSAWSAYDSNHGSAGLVAVRQDFKGAFSGRALLIFPETSSLELMRAVIGRSLSLKDVIEIQDEALAEIGNVILNSWLATIANLLKRNLPVSSPTVIRGDSKRVFEVEKSGTTFVLFLRIKFEINHFQMHGYIALWRFLRL